MAWELETERGRVVMYYYCAPGDTYGLFNRFVVVLFSSFFDDVVEQVNVGATIPAPG